MRSLLIYHIAERASFVAQRHGVSRGASYAPAGWAHEGFIHCSRWAQLQRVARTFFADRTDLIVIEVDTSRVEADVRYERAADTPDDYPHVYGPIPRAAIVGFLRVAWPAPGTPRFDRLIEGYPDELSVVDALCANGSAVRFWHSLGFRDRFVSMRLDRAAHVCVLFAGRQHVERNVEQAHGAGVCRGRLVSPHSV